MRVLSIRIILIASVSFILINGFFIERGQAASSSKWITVRQQVTAYDQVDGRPLVVGTLLPNQFYEVLQEDSDYYYISFGNGTVSVKKSPALLVAKKVQKSMPTKAASDSNLSIITKSETVVYNKIGKDQKGIAVIKGNIRYPIVRKLGDWYIITIAGQIGYIHKNKVTEDLGIPVLMYHHMVEKPEETPFYNNSMVIRVDEFEKQMNYLKQNGWRTILLEELEDYLNHKQNLPGKVAVVTFDDNYLSTQKYAYPILKQNQQKAVVFVIGGKVRGYAQPWDPMTLQYMGHKEISETQDVFSFQHHTQGMHLRERDTQVPYLISKTAEEIEADLLSGREYIGRALKDPASIKYLAYPWGQYAPHTIEAAKAAGIHLAFTTETGNVKLGDDPYTLKRQGVSPAHTMDDFIKKIEGTY
ncbi:polysaccharide deacetylase family protein [Bacillus sp. FJAT-27231]|uniref:polysaccharide deacetylase family protein n=1 Tax=Bacillus sp. FJAT-27231 TaxID=1679168 RepID=UPI000670D43C|nr:polysaccharide deacetylase family protein [Bacillus sp. FJAT-27231]